MGMHILNLLGTLKDVQILKAIDISNIQQEDEKKNYSHKLIDQIYCLLGTHLFEKLSENNYLRNQTNIHYFN